ncbi:phosphinothricin acetyltransferase [Geomicrobium halophilum]|uniref:Phosphinothricin acetyltransferase n=1 Tax=Geomicrobium halophilum TaxID=549000 RepID=A0A841PR14_9BACL|nr:GNAT family N-acetyltransferase [Geomicrobium halophilum]MBB6451230.1 phosphinothricin acetyltransferase [Geomicrobium halophilum]
MNDSIQIDKLVPEDWQQVQQIYLQGISTGHATFQKEAPTWEEWNQSHLLECRMVARSAEDIIGWAALTPISNRAVYAGVAEVSIYIRQNSQGKGVGSKLLKSLIEESEQNGFWTLQSGIFPENHFSVTLHSKFGFREVGRRERMGKMNGVWRDILLLERRSHKVGLD